MNRAEIRSLVYSLIGQVQSNTNYDSDYINLQIKEGYQTICSWSDNAWEWLIEETKIKNPYTTVSSASTGTTLVATSTDNMYENQKVYVSDGNIYEEVKISSITEGTLTLTGAGLTGTYPSDSYIIGRHLILPSDFREIINCKAEYVSGTNQIFYILKRSTEQEIDENHPIITTISTPTHYFIRNAGSGGYSGLFIYPLPDAAWNFEIKYIKTPADLTDATSPVLPLRYHETIAYYTAVNMLKSDPRSRGSWQISAWEKHFLFLLNQMNNENQKKIGYMPRFKIEGEGL